MIKKGVCLLVVMFFLSCKSTVNISKDVNEIKTVLFQSAKDWSKGDLKGFMKAYWKSDELQFIGSKGITYGWDATLANYLKGYPTKEHTGKLKFEVLSVKFLSKDLYSLIGTYHLERKVGEANGIFSLLFKRIDSRWVIISDHSE